MSKDEAAAVRAGASSKEIRQARVRRLLRRIAIWVLVPTLIGIVYYGFVAAPQYDSVAIFRVQSKGRGDAKSRSANAHLVKEYIESRAMLRHLDEAKGFNSHYQSGGDVISRLDGDAGSEESFSNFREKVQIEFLEDSGALRLSVRAFSKETAQEFAREVIAASEAMATTTDASARDARVALASAHIKEAETSLENAQLALTTHTMSLDVEAPPSIAHVAKQEQLHYMRDAARKNLETAIEEMAKLEAELLSEELYLAVISPPSAPSGAAHPQRLWGILTVFVLSFVLMGVFSMLGAAVKEHARF